MYIPHASKPPGITPNLPATLTPAGKWRLGAEVALLLALFAGSLALLPLHRVLTGGAFEHFALVARMVFFVGACTLLLRSTGQRWRDVGLRSPTSWRRVLLLVVAGYIGLALFQLPLALLLKSGSLPPTDVTPFRTLEGNLARYLFFAFPVSLGIAAFGEEMLLRGYLLNRLAAIFGDKMSGRWALAGITQGLLFGVAHAYQGPGGVILTGLVGVLLGMLYLLSGRNLWACIILHGLIDFVSMTMFYLGLVPGG